MGLGLHDCLCGCFNPLEWCNAERQTLRKGWRGTDRNATIPSFGCLCVCVEDIKTLSIYSILQTQLMETLSDGVCSQSCDWSTRQLACEVMITRWKLQGDMGTGVWPYEFCPEWHNAKSHHQKHSGGLVWSLKHTWVPGSANQQILAFLSPECGDGAGASGERQPQSGGWHGLFVRLC